MREPRRGARAVRVPRNALFRRAFNEGPAALAPLELLAILLGPGRDQPPLDTIPEAYAEEAGRVSWRRMAAATPAELAATGIDPVGATRLAAAFHLAHLVDEERRRSDRPRVEKPEHVFERFRLRLRDALQEDLYALSLDARRGLIRERLIGRGTMTDALVDASAIFRAALADGAASIILVHNHPAGDPEPTADDRRLTAKIAGAAELLDLDLADHVIIGGDRFFSFRTSRCLP